MKFSNKKTYSYLQHHVHDDFKNLGYKYWENGILKRMVSQELFSNPVNDGMYQRIDDLLIYLVNKVKQIRLHYSIAHDKDTIFVN